MVKPSMAEETEMGGVIMPSANNAQPPIMAGTIKKGLRLRTRANKAKIPPSPLLSAFKTMLTYFTDV